jgi:hypothetical protein
MKSLIRPPASGKAIITIFMFAVYTIGCGNSSAEQTSPPAPDILVSATATMAFTPTATSSPTAVPSSTPLPATKTLTPLPTSLWKVGWIDLINGYYGYAISLPPSAKVLRNDQIYSYDPQEVPADWDPNDNYFDFLNRTYPPGLCTIIEYQSMFVQITAPLELGGKYSECIGFGGLGVAHWVWSQQEVIVGETSYTATVLGQCESDAPDAKCFTASYGIPLGDQGHVVVHGDDPVLFEILRTYRPVPKTELYCPDPAPTRLNVGTSAYVSTDPPTSYNNVREAPGINQALIGKIEPGRSVELLDGPVCNNSLQWWKVRVSNTRFEGWTPEGDHKRYWLNPCESKENCGVP